MREVDADGDAEAEAAPPLEEQSLPGISISISICICNRIKGLGWVDHQGQRPHPAQRVIDMQLLLLPGHCGISASLFVRTLQRGHDNNGNNCGNNRRRQQRHLKVSEGQGPHLATTWTRESCAQWRAENGVFNNFFLSYF